MLNMQRIRILEDYLCHLYNLIKLAWWTFDNSSLIIFIAIKVLHEETREFPDA